MSTKQRNWLGSTLALAISASQVNADCVLRYGLNEDPLTYDPVTAYQQTQNALVANHLAHTLLTYHSSGARVLRGATSLSVDSDASKIRFALNPSCHWSDGAPVVAADFAAGIHHAMTLDAFPQAPSISRSDEGFDIQAIGDHMLEVGYEGSSEALLSFLSTAVFAPLPTHLGLTGPEYYALPMHQRIMAGPYHVIGAQETFLRLEANPHYCAGLHPQIDRVEMHTFETDEQRMRAFVEGHVDLIQFAPLKQLEVLGTPDNMDMTFVSSGVSGQVNLIVNPTVPGLDNQDVRLALAMALDYQRFVDTGRGELSVTRSLSDGFIVRFGNDANPGLTSEDVSYSDLTRARELMEAAGYSEENPLEITLTTYPLTDYATTARQVASMLSRAHFRVRFEEQESVGAAVDTIYAGNYQTFVDGYMPSLYDMSDSVALFSNDTLAPILAHQREMGAPIAPELTALDKTLDELLDHINLTDDPDERMASIHEAEMLIGKSAIMAPLYQVTRNLVVRSHFSPLPVGFTTPGGVAGQYWTSEQCKE